MAPHDAHLGKETCWVQSYHPAMGPGRCTRCGRERPMATYGGASVGTGPPIAPGAVYEGTWAWFVGGDVCPTCQTPDEQREAVSRAAAAVQAEIARRMAAGTAPDPFEPPLIEFVMTVGAHEPVPDTDEQFVGEPVRAGEDDSLSTSSRRHLSVAVTGAFYTGSSLSVQGSDVLSVREKLQSQLGISWRFKDLELTGGTFASGGGFSEDIPLIIARRDCTDQFPLMVDLLTSGPTSPPGERPFHPLVSARSRALAIDLYDLGIGVLTAWVDVTALACAPLADTARAVKKLTFLRPTEHTPSALASRLQDIATAVSHEYRNAVERVRFGEQEAGWLARVAPDDHGRLPRRSLDVIPGRLLWLHPINVLRTEPVTQADALELAPVVRGAIEIEGGVFAPGIGSSAIVVDSRSRSAARAVRLTVLHWAYHALLMKVDRDLLDTLNSGRWTARGTIRELEKDADEVFADFLQVESGRTRLESHLIGLGGDELAVWETIAKVQRYDTIVRAVDQKLDTLDKVAQRRVDLATADRARRTANILGLLTVMTVVTLTGGVISVLSGAPDNTFTALEGRAIALGLALVVALGIYWLAFVWRYGLFSSARGLRRRTRAGTASRLYRTR